MMIYLSLLFGAIALSLVSGVFWNGNLQSMRVRPRPTRHYSPTSYHNTHHRVSNPLLRYSQPSYFPQLKTYSPINHGPLAMNSARHKHQHHSPIPHLRPMRPNPHPMESFQQPSPMEYSKFQSPISNFVESGGLKVESGSSLHGYLSPTYSGWKPVSKPFFSLKGPISEMNYAETTEAYYPYSTIQKEGGRMNSMFGNDLHHLKSLHGVQLKSDYSENQGVTVPVPRKSVDTFQIPSMFHEHHPKENNFQPFQIAASETKEKPVTHKPFPKFSSRPKSPPLSNDSNSESEVSTDSPQLLSKFKISRPKLKVQSHASFQEHNEPEIEGLGQGTPTKVTLSLNNRNSPYSQHQSPLSLNPKIHKLKPRVKVKERKPEAFVNTDQLSHVLSYHPPGQTPATKQETKRNSDSHLHSQPLPLTHHHHPSPTFLENETYDATPFRPTSFPTGYPFLSSDLMNEFKGSDEEHHHQRHVPRTPIRVSTQKIAEDTSIGIGSKQNVVERPYQTLGDGERVIRRKKSKHVQNQQRQESKATTETPIPTQVPFNSQNNNDQNQSPVYPEDFYLPPGFSQNPSLGGQKPVSFMTMPNAQPQVIHHTLPSQSYSPQHTPHHHQGYPINFSRSPGPYNNFNQQPHQHGTTPTHNAFPQNNNNQSPFLFMNIQNGQLQTPNSGTQKPYSQQQRYQESASSNPFYHHHHHDQHFQPQQQAGGGGPLELNPSHHHHHQSPPPPDRSTPPQSHYTTYPIRTPSVESYGYGHDQGQPNFIVQNPNVNLEAYASNEYGRIPLEFMNDLRPILLEEPHSTHNPIPTSSSQALPQNIFEATRLPRVSNSYDSSSTLQQNSYDGSRQHFFGNLGQPFYDAARAPGNSPYEAMESSKGASAGYMRDVYELQPHPYSPSGHRPPGDSTNVYVIPQTQTQIRESGDKRIGEEYDNYKTAASNFQTQIMRHREESTTPTLQPSHTQAVTHRPPVVSMAPLQAFSFVTTISPIRDMDFSRPQSVQGQVPKWSKLKVGDAVLSSTEHYKSHANKYKKLVTLTKENETKSQMGHENHLPSPIPRLTSTLRSVREESENFASSSYLYPTPLVVKNMMTMNPSQEDSSHSNTLKSSTRIRGIGLHQNQLQVQGTTQTPLSTTADTTDRRQFRRRRPGILGRRKLIFNQVQENVENESPILVTTHHPRRVITQSTPISEDIGEAGFESSRLSLKSVRGAGFEIGLEEKGRKSTTPGPLDPNPVTYGESQWFQIKGSHGKSEELDSYHHHRHHHHHHVIGEEKDSTHVGSNVEKREEEISFSSKILSTTPYVKLEPLGIGSDGEVKESKSHSPTKTFHSTEKGAEEENHQAEDNLPMSVSD